MSDEKKVVSLDAMGDINKMRPLLYKHIEFGRTASETRIPVEMFKMLEKLVPVMKNNPKTQANVRFLMESLMLPRHNLVCLYLLMKEVDEFMTKHDIVYWADGGTNLALARDHQQIPYDDDVDICVFQTGFEKCTQYVHEFTKRGYHISCTPTMIKISTAHNWARSVSRTFGCVTLDIFCYKKKNREIFLDNIRLRAKWPNARYKCKEVFPIIRHKYGPITFMGANDPTGYCNRLYPGWKETAVIELRDSPTVSHVNIKSDTLSLPYSFVMKYAPKYKITLEEIHDVRNKIDNKINIASSFLNKAIMSPLMHHLNKCE
jgi:phosphorylcholine metabolism protein LicD